MRLTTFVVACTLIATVLVALPAGEAGVAGTASANTCWHHLSELDTKGFTQCTQQQCRWNDFPRGRPVCTD